MTTTQTQTHQLQQNFVFPERPQTNNNATVVTSSLSSSRATSPVIIPSAPSIETTAAMASTLQPHKQHSLLGIGDGSVGSNVVGSSVGITPSTTTTTTTTTLTTTPNLIGILPPPPPPTTTATIATTTTIATPPIISTATTSNPTFGSSDPVGHASTFIPGHALGTGSGPVPTSGALHSGKFSVPDDFLKDLACLHLDSLPSPHLHYSSSQTLLPSETPHYTPSQKFHHPTSDYFSSTSAVATPKQPVAPTHPTHPTSSTSPSDVFHDNNPFRPVSNTTHIASPSLLSSRLVPPFASSSPSIPPLQPQLPISTFPSQLHQPTGSFSGSYSQPQQYPSSKSRNSTQSIPPQRIPLARSLSNTIPVHTPSPLNPKISFETLIQLDIQLNVASKASLDASSRLSQIIIEHNILNRLQASLHTFYKILAEKFKSDPSKFAAPYLQAVDLTSSILKNDLSTTKQQGFMSSLKSSNRGLLNSFITLIKTSPSFICACISTMHETEINSLFQSPTSILSTAAPSTDSAVTGNGIEDLASLQRTNTLDIIFYSFFPPVASIKQRHDYFSFILAFAFDNEKNVKYHKLIMAVLDRIYFACKHDLLGFQEILLGMLQDGQFLVSNKTPNPINLHHPPSLSCPSSAAGTPPTPTIFPNSNYPASSTSLSSSHSIPITQFSHSEMPLSDLVHSPSVGNILATPTTPSLSMFPLLPSTSSAPTSSYSSPELPAVSTSAYTTSTVVTPAFVTPTFSNKPTTASPAVTSLQRLNNSYKSHPQHHSSSQRNQPQQQYNHNYSNQHQSQSQSQTQTQEEFERKKTKFLTSYIARILTHLNNVANEIIPAEFKDFISLTFSKVSESCREKALQFIFHRYFLAKHLSNLVTCPESFGLLHDFFISDIQRQRILLCVFQYLQLYIEVVLLDSSSASSLHIPPKIQSQILTLYEQFTSLVSSSSNQEDACLSSRPPSPISTASVNNFDMDESFINYPFDGGSFVGQLIVLSPADIFTLYNSLFSSFSLQKKPANATYPITVNHYTNSDNISQHSNNSSTSVPVNSSSSNPFQFSASLDNPSFYFHQKSSSSTVTLPNMHIASSLASLNELNTPFGGENDPDRTSTSTSSYGDLDDSAFEWNLADIKSDIEPAAKELVKKFSYLQPKSSSSNYHSAFRPQRLHNIRLPHPHSERWQIFRVGEDNTVIDINETSIIDHLDSVPAFPTTEGFEPSILQFDDLTGNNFCNTNSSSHDDFHTAGSTSFEFDRFSPIHPANKFYFDSVVSSLDMIISENSSIIFNTNKNDHNEYHDSDMSSPPTGSNFSIAPSRLYSGSLNPSIQGHWYGDYTKIHSLPNIAISLPSISHICSHSAQYLVKILTDAGNKSNSMRDYYKACEYFNSAQAVFKLLPPSSSPNHYQASLDVNYFILKHLKQTRETTIQKYSETISKCDELGGPYQIYLQRDLNGCDFHLANLNNLRTKVWYTTEVRTSTLWSRARDVAVTLQKGSQAQAKGSEDEFGSANLFGSSLRNHTLKRNSSTSSLTSAAAYTFKRLTGSTNKRDYVNKRHSISHLGGVYTSSSLSSTSNSSSSTTAVGSSTYMSPTLASSSSSFSGNPTTLVETLFAPQEYVGLNKLSDKEADATEKWLEGQQIQNFCTGEELIHRFSCEIDDLVKRIIGDAFSNHPSRGQSYLTSSALFRPDLWKIIAELEGYDRSSTASISFGSGKGLSNSAGPGGNPNNSHQNSSGGSGGGSNTGGGGFFGLGGLFGSSTKLDIEPDLKRRGSTESVPVDVYRPSHLRTKTSSSSQSDLTRSYSLRGHKLRKSSPNLIDLVSPSLDLGTGSNKRVPSATDLNYNNSNPVFDNSSNGPGINRPHSSAAGSSTEKLIGHRRNKSLNENLYGNNSGNSNNTNIITEEMGFLHQQPLPPAMTFPTSSGIQVAQALPSPTYPQQQQQQQQQQFQQQQQQCQFSSTAVPTNPQVLSSSSSLSSTTSPFIEERFGRRQQQQEHDKWKDALKQMVFEIQMRLISLLFTDLGIEGWADGMYIYLILFFFHY